ncbi:MAG TPA: putative zinc-binding protein [Candidatus Cloacimonadota bacterium]|nr:putative zinc-binding protein [Candidatus Cloacimonadota bacterium]
MAECKCGCTSSCASNDAPAKVYACAGASNAGKISMDLAIALHREGRYQMSCATGVGADICGFTEAAKTEGKLNLLIDGCPVGCLKTMFDNKGITNYDHIVLTEMGITKSGDFSYEQGLIDDLMVQLTTQGL